MLFAIKILYILFFVVLTIFLIYETHLTSNFETNQANPYINTRNLKEAIAFSSGVTGLMAYFTSKSRTDLEEAIKHYREEGASYKAQIAEMSRTESELRREAVNSKIETSLLNLRIGALQARQEELQAKLLTSEEKEQDLANHLRRLNAINDNNNYTSEEKSKLINQELENVKSNGKYNKFIDSNFNLQEFLSSLTQLELFAFISLCFNAVILSALSSIFFI